VVPVVEVQEMILLHQLEELELQDRVSQEVVELHHFEAVVVVVPAQLELTQLKTETVETDF
jgi:hypothetical protein